MRSAPFISLFFLLLGACSRHEDPAFRSGDEIIADAYAKVVDQIQDLSNTGQLETWIVNTQEPFRINSHSDLETALGYFGRIPEDQIERIEDEFEGADSMFHFSYDGDFSVLVAFDDRGKQTFIHPPGMAPAMNSRQEPPQL